MRILVSIYKRSFKSHFSFESTEFRPKKDTFRIVFDTSHLNSNNDQPLESWPFELLGLQLDETKRNSKTALDLLFAYAHFQLDEQTNASRGFPSPCDKLLVFM